MKPNKKISYHLLSDMTEEQYAALPEDVRRVYVSTAKKIPMDQKEKLDTIQQYPQYFEKRQAKPFAHKVKRLLNLKSKIDKIKTKAAVRDLQSRTTDKRDL
jgi:predicted alternative tryptophan synthase beta-subunit